MSLSMDTMRRAGSLALFAVLIAAGAAALIGAAGALDGEVTRLTDLKARYERLAAETPELRQTLEALATARRTQASDLLPGGSMARAAAAFQDYLKEQVSAAGGDIASMQVIEPEAEGGLERVGLRLTAKLSHNGLKRVLHGLETGRPAVFVDSLDLRPDMRRSAFRRAANPGEQVDLNVILTLMAFKEPDGDESG